MDFPKNALFKSYAVICLPGIGLAVFDRSMYIKRNIAALDIDLLYLEYFCHRNGLSFY